MMGLGASDFEFGVDPSADPELALVSKSLSHLPTVAVCACFGCVYPTRVSLFVFVLLFEMHLTPWSLWVSVGSGHIVFCSFVQALRVSMEEQRQRQEEEARRAAAASAAEAGMPTPTVDGKKGIWGNWRFHSR